MVCKQLMLSSLLFTLLVLNFTSDVQSMKRHRSQQDDVSDDKNRGKFKQARVQTFHDDDAQDESNEKNGQVPSNYHPNTQESESDEDGDSNLVAGSLVDSEGNEELQFNEDEEAAMLFDALTISNPQESPHINTPTTPQRNYIGYPRRWGCKSCKNVIYPLDWDYDNGDSLTF